MKIIEEIVKNTELGIDAIDNVAPYVQSQDLANKLAQHKISYQKIKTEAEQQLTDHKVKESKPNKFQKSMLKMSAKFNAMFDPSDSHISEMMIEGTNMGINSVQSVINEMQSEGDEVPQLAVDYVNMMQSNINELRSFL
ncbi:MAG: hypothetical protein GX891_00070 [Clostridiales bacterium]|nr:hypothetical protein [Clostridiales bacterium]